MLLLVLECLPLLDVDYLLVLELDLLSQLLRLLVLLRQSLFVLFDDSIIPHLLAHVHLFQLLDSPFELFVHPLYILAVLLL